MSKNIYEESMIYHQSNPPGKISIEASKPLETQKDLSLAYSPGVAGPVLEIAKDPQAAYKYTAKGNLIAVISNGTAILGLGNKGALASKPVMEGKSVLFKVFGNVDAIDIEVDETDPEKFIEIVKAISPSFGGINLEDIAAPECFQIEKTLKEELDIPVFHDDQHGTAVVASAGLINALEITGKKIEELKVVACGAGAAGISCLNLFCELGLQKENILLFDSQGLVYETRKEGMDEYKIKYARENNCCDLREAMKGADLFLGLAAADIIDGEMVKSMAEQPILFTMANPEPEIAYDLAKAAVPNAIIATGRSDYPNQVNNVLGFPFLFRAALDVQAANITEEMKMACAKGLADLARTETPDDVKKLYPAEKLEFGPDYIIPKPFDPRLISTLVPLIAEAATKN